jgi:YceI-like domain
MKAVKRIWWVGGLTVLVLATGAAAAFAYTARNTPERLKLAVTSPPAIASPSPTPPLPGLDNACVQGSNPATSIEWTLQPGSMAGFRAHENFLEFQFPHEAVARSDKVAGYLLSSSDRRQLQDGCIAVDLRGLTSVDKLPPPLPPASNRDGLFPDIFDLTDYPLAIFKPDPMDLPETKSGQVAHLKISGQITIRGATRPVAVKADCRLSGETLACAGSAIVDARQFALLLPGSDSPIQVDPMITIEFSLLFS